MRGYVVSGVEPEDGAVLVFAHDAAEAKRMGWPMIVEDYGLAEYTEVRVRWARDATPEAWGATEPTVIEPAGCETCCRWYSSGPIPPGDECINCLLGVDP